MPSFLGGVVGTKKFQDAFASRTIEKVESNERPESTTSNNKQAITSYDSKFQENSSECGVLSNSIAESSDASSPRRVNIETSKRSTGKDKLKSKNQVVSTPSFYDDTSQDQPQSRSNHTKDSTSTETTGSEIEQKSNSTITSTSSLHNSISMKTSLGESKHRTRIVQQLDIPIIEEELELEEKASRKPWMRERNQNRYQQNESTRKKGSRPVHYIGSSPRQGTKYSTNPSSLLGPSHGRTTDTDKYGEFDEYSSDAEVNNTQQKSSWDSDGQFSTREIDRIKNKTRRIRSRRVEKSSSPRPMENSQSQLSDEDHDDDGFDSFEAIKYLQVQAEERKNQSEINRLQLEEELWHRQRRFQRHRKKIEKAYGLSHSNSTRGQSYENRAQGERSILGIDDNKSTYSSHTALSEGKSVRTRRQLNWGNNQNPKEGSDMSTRSTSSFGKIMLSNNNTNKQSSACPSTSADDRSTRGIQESNFLRHSRHGVVADNSHRALSGMRDKIFDTAKPSDANTSEETLDDDLGSYNERLNPKYDVRAECDSEIVARDVHNDEQQDKHMIEDDGIIDEDVYIDFTLHDLCGEASTIDDIAWRNALYLTSIHPLIASIPTDDGNKWLPLHISVMDLNPPPSFILSGLLYAYPEACSMADNGGRLPLHLIAASSADVVTMRTLVEVYPDAIHQRDEHGFIPLHLFLLNRCNEDRNDLERSDSDQNPIEQVRILLGMSMPLEAKKCSSRNLRYGANKMQRQSSIILHRRRDHLDIPFHELPERMNQNNNRKPKTIFNHDPTHEINPELWRTYPADVQKSIRRLANWRFKKEVESLKSQHQSDEAIEVGMAEIYPNGVAFVNRMDWRHPTCIPAPGTNQLPIHMTLEKIMLVYSNSEVASTNDMCVDDVETNDYDIDRSPKNVFCRSSTEQKRGKQVSAAPATAGLWMSILRLLAAEGPESLTWKDSCGLTPLLQVLLPQNYNPQVCRGLQFPSLDIIEILLGKRSAMYSVNPPTWATNIPLYHDYQGSRLRIKDNLKLSRMNAAMIPYHENHQFPLHIATDELQFLSNDLYASIVQTIYESYPAAATIQDWKGRTPLHVALHSFQSRITGTYPPNLRVLNLLSEEDSVFFAQDDFGNTPFDVLLDNAHLIPKVLTRGTEADDWDNLNKDTMRVYRRLFLSSLSKYRSQRTNFSSSNTLNSADMLLRLRVLPPWLRVEACSSEHVRRILLDEVTNPWSSAIILLDGVMLAALVLLYRLDMDNLADHVKIVDVDMLYPHWYTYAVYCTATTRLLTQAASASIASSVGEFQFLCFQNVWFWFDILSMCFAIVSSVLVVDGRRDEEFLLQLGTVGTGLLWLCVIGYFRKWWYGMALFVGGFTTIVSRLTPALIAGCILMIAHAQMFYTRFQLSCVAEDSWSSFTETKNTNVAPVCTVYDSYRSVYMLARGENSLLLTDGGTEGRISSPGVTMTGVFIVGWITFCIMLLVCLISAATDLDYDDMGKKLFWEPLMASLVSHTMFRDRSRKRNCCKRTSMASVLGQVWESCMSSLGLQNHRHTCTDSWTKPMVSQRCNPLRVPILGTCLSVVIVPIWMLIGGLTLGLLWPPQIRQFLFGATGGPNSTSRTRASNERLVLLTKLREDINQIKLMSYDQNEGVERELFEIKNTLQIAINEE